jgi:hypothetical protein
VPVGVEESFSAGVFFQSTHEVGLLDWLLVPLPGHQEEGGEEKSEEESGSKKGRLEERAVEVKPIFFVDKISHLFC